MAGHRQEFSRLTALTAARQITRRPQSRTERRTQCRRQESARQDFTNWPDCSVYLQRPAVGATGAPQALFARICDLTRAESCVARPDKDIATNENNGKHRGDVKIPRHSRLAVHRACHDLCPASLKNARETPMRRTSRVIAVDPTVLPRVGTVQYRKPCHCGTTKLF